MIRLRRPVSKSFSKLSRVCLCQGTLREVIRLDEMAVLRGNCLGHFFVFYISRRAHRRRKIASRSVSCLKVADIVVAVRRMREMLRASVSASSYDG